MLSIANRLLFPNLVRLKEVDIRGKKVPLYRLDWDYTEKVKKDNHEEWCNKYYNDKDIPYVPSLPDEYMDWSNNLVFALNRNYKDEIQRMAQRGINEWNISRGFDTSIREVCLKPAIEFVWCSFYLICDCLYDSDKQYYSRNDPRGNLAKYILPYRFWSHQTGRGVIGHHSRLEKIDYLKVNNFIDLKEREEAERLSNSISVHEDRMNKAYDGMQLDIPR